MNQTAQRNMIKQQLRTNAVVNDKILSQFEHLAREQFVPSRYTPFAYSDMKIPLEHQQCMMSPSEEGLILQALKLTGCETVLEVGTGTGYLTALLSQLCKKVISFDLYPDFTQAAQMKLSAHGCDNVELHTANAFEGWAQGAPYDCIILSGGVSKIPDQLFLQLAPQGRLIALVGQGCVLQAQLHTLEANKLTLNQFLFNTSLPALTPLHPLSKFIF